MISTYFTNLSIDLIISCIGNTKWWHQRVQARVVGLLGDHDRDRNREPAGAEPRPFQTTELALHLKKPDWRGSRVS